MKTNFSFILILAGILTIYGSVSYYTGFRSLFFFQKIMPSINLKLYWIFYLLFAFSFIILRFIKNILPENIEPVANIISYYSIAIMLYLLLIYMCIDILSFIGKQFNLMPPNLRNHPYYWIILGTFVFALLTGIIIYGAFNAKNPKINKYNISINKTAGNIKSLHAVMISDIHINETTAKSSIIKLVHSINGLNPDIVFITGDIIDDDFTPFFKGNYAKLLSTIESKYGIFACLGNHDYFGGKSDELKQELIKYNIHLLTDEVITINNSIYIIGRNDKITETLDSPKRKALSDIIKDIDASKPLILLEHQPSELDEAINAKIDLQISGHTHAGQMFPINLITNAIFKQHWGYWKKESFQLIVSSGYGTWGPPIRVGSKSEIVEIIINFD